MCDYVTKARPVTDASRPSVPISVAPAFNVSFSFPQAAGDLPLFSLPTEQHSVALELNFVFDMKPPMQEELEDDLAAEEENKLINEVSNLFSASCQYSQVYSCYLGV